MMDLAKLKELAQAATPGPWVVIGTSFEAIHIECHSSDPVVYGYRVADVIDSNGYPVNAKNADYIAAANPKEILSLISRMEELEKHAEALADSLNTVLNFAEAGAVPPTEIARDAEYTLSAYRSEHKKEGA